jgi:hypothetical protein
VASGLEAKSLQVRFFVISCRMVNKTEKISNFNHSRLMRNRGAVSSEHSDLCMDLLCFLHDQHLQGYSFLGMADDFIVK